MITPYQTVPWQIFLLSDQGKAGCAGAGNCLTGQSSRPRRRPSACSSCWRESTSTLCVCRCDPVTEALLEETCHHLLPASTVGQWTCTYEIWLSSEAAPRRCQSSCSIYRWAPIYYSWKLTHHQRFFQETVALLSAGRGVGVCDDPYQVRKLHLATGPWLCHLRKICWKEWYVSGVAVVEAGAVPLHCQDLSGKIYILWIPYLLFVLQVMEKPTCLSWDTVTSPSRF